VTLQLQVMLKFKLKTVNRQHCSTGLV